MSFAVPLLSVRCGWHHSSVTLMDGKWIRWFYFWNAPLIFDAIIEQGIKTMSLVPYWWYNHCITSLTCCKQLTYLFLGHLVDISFLTQFILWHRPSSIFPLIILACGNVNSCGVVGSQHASFWFVYPNIDLKATPRHVLVTDFHGNSVCITLHFGIGASVSITACRLINMVHI